MSNTTQKDFDAMIDELKKSINTQLEESGRSLSMELELGNKDIIDSIYTYQNDIAPIAEQLGLCVPTMRELFGINVILTLTITVEE